jgi:hypothetical protein
VLPIGRVEWEAVEKMHKEHERFGKRGRTFQLLKNKFMRLVNMKKPSGDADIPDEVLEAKAIMEELNIKADSGADVDDEELGIGGDDRSIVEVDDDSKVAASPRRRQLVQSRSASNPIDNLINLMVLQQNERMTRPSNDSGNVSLMLQMQQQMLQQQQQTLDRIANRLERLEDKKDK